MRASTITALLAVLLFIPAAGPASAEGLRLPQYETVVFDNGLTLQLLRDDTVPMVSFEVWIDVGAISDPAGKAGLASLTADALRKGAGDFTAPEFAGAMDLLGATFGTSVNRERTRINLNLLAKDFDRGLALLGDAVLRPAFDEAEIAKLAAQMAEGISQAKDNPRHVIGDYFDAFLYGDHPYGNPVSGTETGLSSITAEDVREFYAGHYGSDRIIVTVAGGVDPKEAEAKLRALFGNMARAQSPAVTVSAPTPPKTARVLLINKSDTPQTWFRIGNLGPVYGEPEYAAAEVVRTVFGGRFTSWLNTKLRIEAGLTYGAGYSFSRGRAGGSAYIRSFTATETTKEAVDLALAQLERLHTDGISEEELASAQAYLKGQMPYEYETAAQVGYAVTEFAFYGQDRSRLDGLFAEIDAVTLADCREVVGKYFKRDHLVMAAIGVEAEVADILREYGDLTVRENADPGFR